MTRHGYSAMILSLAAGLALVGLAGCSTAGRPVPAGQTGNLAALLDKASACKQETLVFKGFYVGMPRADAESLCGIYKLPSKSVSHSPEGKLTELRLNAAQTAHLFEMDDINPAAFISRFASEYRTPAPQYIPGPEEVVAGEIVRKDEWKITDNRTYELSLKYAPPETSFLGQAGPRRNFTFVLRRPPGTFN